MLKLSIASALMVAFTSAVGLVRPSSVWKPGTPARRSRRGYLINKNRLPHGYPGAKLDRKALAGKCTLRG